MLQIIALLSWLALPVGLIVIADDWFIRPRRQIAASPAPTVDPPLMKTLYMLLPVFILAAVVRLLLAERLDFSAVAVRHNSTHRCCLAGGCRIAAPQAVQGGPGRR